MDEKITFYQHDDFPWVLVKVTDRSWFESFDYDKKKWVRDPDMFYRVYEDDEYHEISEKEADEIIEKIPDGLKELSDEEAGNVLESIFG